MDEEQMLEEEYFRELERVAFRVYGQRFDDLCKSRKETVETLLRTGDF